MAFIDLTTIALEDFRPGVKSAARIGQGLIMAVMTIEGGLSDAGHEHPFDQCGLVIEGRFKLTIGDETQDLGPGQGYFIPAGVLHSWSVAEGRVKILDVSAKAG